MESMKLLRNGMVFGVNVTGEHCDKPCEACILSKQSARPFPKSCSRGSRIIELVHSDLCGPMPKSHGGFS